MPAKQWLRGWVPWCNSAVDRINREEVWLRWGEGEDALIVDCDPKNKTKGPLRRCQIVSPPTARERAPPASCLHLTNTTLSSDMSS
jgi:hypothetical protein